MEVNYDSIEKVLCLFDTDDIYHIKFEFILPDFFDEKFVFEKSKIKVNRMEDTHDKSRT